VDRFRVAIQPPSEQRRRLALCCCGLTAVTWYEPESFLLTLRCFGDLQEAARLDLLEALEEVEAAPIAIGLASVQIGPRHGGGSVALQVSHSDSLTELLSAIDLAVKPLRLKSRGSERPHLILGTYGQSPRHTDDYLQQFGGMAMDPFVATQFGLYREHSSPKRTYFQEEQLYSLEERQQPHLEPKIDFPLS
jgi:2'-5' RNA ligase